MPLNVPFHEKSSAAEPRDIEDRIAAEFNQPQKISAIRADVATANFELREILDFLGEDGSGRSVLDVGFGRGIFANALENKGYIVSGVELSDTLLEIAQKNYPDINFKKGSATSIPFPGDSFDCLICIEVLEHVPDTEVALYEMARVLKPGGKMIIIDKNILSIHPKYFIPTFVWKSFLEMSNKWFYSRNFPFREKYFIPTVLNSKILKAFRKSQVEFLRSDSGGSRTFGFKRMLAIFHKLILDFLLKTFPSLSFFVAWKAEK